MPEKSALDSLDLPSLVSSPRTPARQALRRLGGLLLRIAPQLVTLTLLGFVSGWVTRYTPYANGPAIRSDGTGYHIWTRALLDRDLSFCRWENDPERPFAADLARNGFCQNKYPPGLALLRFPVMAFLVDRSDPNKLTITPAEHTASLVCGGVILWLQAALLLWAAAALRLAPWRSCIAVVLCIFGTGLFHYATYDGSFTHAYSAFFCALLLWAAAREHGQARPMPLSVLIIASFFLLALRSTNVFLLSELCLGYVVWRGRSLPRAELLQRKLLPIALGAGTAIALQLAYNCYAAGGFRFSSYGEETFHFDQPMQGPVLFSYERGLFTYYPIFGLALICGFALRATRKLTLLLAALVLTYTVLYGFWASWYLGGGMGHRGFVELVPLVALVLCIAWSEMRWRAYAPALVVGLVCASVTLQITYGYWNATFRSDHETEQNYWAHQHLFESFLTGGTDCRPSRCDIWKGECTRENAPQFRFCSERFKHAGNCIDGGCQPVVALRTLSTPSRYLSTPAPRRGQFWPIFLTRDEVGRPEKFIWVSDPVHPSKIRLITLPTERYVTAPVHDDGPNPLFAATRQASERETFTRRGSYKNFVLRAWNGKFISSVSVGPNRDLLKADADNIEDAAHFTREYARP
jgi:hypothetical protein